MEELKTCKKGHTYSGLVRQCQECQKQNNFKNKSKRQARTRSWRGSNKEKEKQTKKDWRLKNLSKVKDKEMEYRKANPEKIRNKLKRRDSKKLSDYSKKYRLENPEYFKNYLTENRHRYNFMAAKRRGAKLQATPPWLTKQHLEQTEFLYACAKDLEQMFGTKWHVDHIVPLQGKNVSGLHVPWNLQVIRAEENLKKGNKLEQASA